MITNRDEWIQEADEIREAIERGMAGGGRRELLSSEFLDFDYIIKHPNKRMWNWHLISMNPSISWEFIMSTLEEYPWDFTCLVERDDFPLDFFIQNMHLHERWDWYLLSSKKNIPWQTIVENWDLPWDRRSLPKRLDVDWEFILDRVDEEGVEAWNWSLLSESVPADILKENMNYPWDFEHIKKFSCEMVLDYPEKDWNLKIFHQRNKIEFHRCKQQLPARFRKLYPRLPWDSIREIALVNNMSSHDENDLINFYNQSGGIPWDLVIAHHEVNWDYTGLAVYANNSRMVLQLLLSDIHPDFLYCLTSVTDNDFIIENMDLPWDFSYFSKIVEDPQLVLDYPDAGWNFEIIARRFPGILDRL